MAVDAGTVYLCSRFVLLDRLISAPSSLPATVFREFPSPTEISQYSSTPRLAEGPDDLSPSLRSFLGGSSGHPRSVPLQDLLLNSYVNIGCKFVARCKSTPSGSLQA